MIQKDDLDKFKRFSNSGGVVAPDNLTKGRTLKSLAESVSASLTGSIADDADYTRDSIGSLPAVIRALAVELDGASVSLGEWNAYLEAAAVQEDLTQVALGVEVKRMLDDVPNDTPADSMLPITSKTEIAELESAIKSIESLVPGVIALMTTINGVLVQPDPPAPTDGSTPKKPVIPPLPVDAIKKAKAKAVELQGKVGVVSGKAQVIAGMATSGDAERKKALKYFKQAIQFTIGEGQVKTPAIKDAAREIYPDF